MRAIEPGERVRLGMLAGAIPREVEQCRRRVAPAEGPVVTHVDPGPPGRGLAVGQHGRTPGTDCRRRARARPPTHGRAGPLNEGSKKSRAAADLIRQAQGHALAGVALRSTPSASVTTLRRPARARRARQRHLARAYERASRRPGRAGPRDSMRRRPVPDRVTWRVTARFITARAGSRLAWSDGQTASLTCFSRLPSAHPTARKPP